MCCTSCAFLCVPFVLCFVVSSVASRHMIALLAVGFADGSMHVARDVTLPCQLACEQMA